ncbi:CGG triplet repeat-binding protein 1 [Plakobranchus ocellatus]|uniref:CGG triplet repeat-binding protein 1 n=1 Tax=Plakobranchus ocellatus TaxID=259542 RepID=A0AAV4BCS3_9GAST|nr:CGG triplet repeat-binding protein 1 [Plakobranchus ocellatus]
MDAFVVKTRDPKANDKSKCSTKTTVMERHAQFPKETHVAGQKLFCTSCNLVLDHTRKSSVSSHLGSGKHKQKRDLTEKSNQPAKKQRVLTESSSSVPSTIASQERNELCMEWVAMLAAANIPLSKTDHPAVRDFLHKKVVNGGAIPHRKQLQECYLEREYSKRKEEVKLLLKGKAVSIMTDEMSDDNGRWVKSYYHLQCNLI